MTGSYTYQSTTGTLTVSQKELSDFSQQFPEIVEFRHRIAELFWLNLYTLEKAYGINPYEILEQVLALEQGRPTLRKPTRFRAKPLKGLMHAHWFCARFIPQNIVNELRSNGIADVANAVFGNGFNPDAIPTFVHSIIYEPVQKRTARGRLSGEWIIYASEVHNYYLCCCQHNSRDVVHKDLIRYARKDFPQLRWFKDNRDLVGQTIAEDLDTLLRGGKVKTLRTTVSDYGINELLCTIDYDNIDKYCTNFLLFLLSSLLNLEEIHILDPYTMQSPKEHLLNELKRRGLPVDSNLDTIKAALKITRPPSNSTRPSTYWLKISPIAPPQMSYLSFMTFLPISTELGVTFAHW
jgi:hypothetical protein